MAPRLQPAESTGPLSEGFFRIKTPENLLAKIAKELRAFSERPDDDELALNVCLSIAHWPEWYGAAIGESRSPPVSAASLRSTHDCFAWCLQLANGGKHWRITREVKRASKLGSTSLEVVTKLDAKLEPVESRNELFVCPAGGGCSIPLRLVFDDALAVMANLMNIPVASLM